MLNYTLTIVMYHYVRDLIHSRYPEIKGLPTEQFKEQVAYIKKYYNVVSGDELLGALASGEGLPPRALLLTFDDGYIDHFANVFPVLFEEKLSGCFFPPARCILENSVLDVNKIHFILASAPDKKVIIDYIFRAIQEYGKHYQLQDKSYYWNRLASKSRFDPPEIIFIKRILQRELPEELRRIITDYLFQKYVTADEAGFSKEVYMSLDQLVYLKENHMYIGSHGYDHYWLNSLSAIEQERQIELSLEFLKRTGSGTDRWIMCYPYGAYDNTLLSILANKNCKVGLTTEVGVANIKKDNLQTLPRIDTNDLPKDANAEPNNWTLRILNDSE